MSDERSSLTVANARLQTARALVQSRTREVERAAEERAAFPAGASATAIRAADDEVAFAQARRDRALVTLREAEVVVWAARTRVSMVRRRLHASISHFHGSQERLCKARQRLVATGIETPDLHIASDGRLARFAEHIAAYQQQIADLLGVPLANVEAALARLDQELAQLSQ
jgi:hypothetical protein